MKLPNVKLPDVYTQMILTLFIFSLFGIYKYGIEKTVPQLAVAVITAAVLDIGIKYYKTKSFIIPKSAIISGFFVALLLNIGQVWYIVALTAAIAVLSKHILRLKGRHFFNPAGFAVLLSGLLLNVPQGWWGAENIPAILVLGVLILYRIKRFRMIISFLVAYFLLFFISKSFAISINAILNPLILFFAFFMLTEHKTSPLFKKGMIIYGVLVGVLSFAFLYFNFMPSYFVLLALIIGNIVAWIMNWKAV